MADEESDQKDSDNDDVLRRRKRGLLKLFYGVQQEAGQSKADPYDINEAAFQHDAYLEKVFKEKSLSELMDKETEIVKQIRSLDSDMQTLVYENYNKFISATDTIKKMKTDFHKMEDEMSKLSSTLVSVTQFSDTVSDALHEKRGHIAKLSGVHTLLRKLQFLFELPARLRKCVQMKQYFLAVRYYAKAKDVIQKYNHMPSFQGIHSDCEDTISQLRISLKAQLQSPDSTTRELTECVDLLLKLEEPAGDLCEEFLSLAKSKVGQSLDSLSNEVSLCEQRLKQSEQHDYSSHNNSEISETEVKKLEGDIPVLDILEFVDVSCNGFLSDISLVIASYVDLFLGRDAESETAHIESIAQEKLNNFMTEHTTQYFALIRRRLELETPSGDIKILVRALDKFHRKIQALLQLVPYSSVGRTGANIVALAAHTLVSQYSQNIDTKLSQVTTEMRQSLVSSRLANLSKSQTVADVLASSTNQLVDYIKSILISLKGFLNSDVTFSNKPYFRGPFCIDDVREGLVVCFLKNLVTSAKVFCTEDERTPVPASLLLILSKLCLDFSNQTVSYLLNITEEWFPVDTSMRGACVVTSNRELSENFHNAAQDLLNSYVRIQGSTVSQMIRKSVEARDWLNTIEPRSVRAVMKRVIEDITAMDTQVGFLLEEGVRKANSSDSSKWTHTYSTSKYSAQRYLGGGNSGGGGGGSRVDAGLLSNIQKLFTERIEVFTSVEFSKVSVMTGIVKIVLKTLVECLRLKTFSKFGLQQIQVDTHYLQLYLWRFVSDENIAHFLLDEAVNSAINRCLNQELMEPGVINIICERITS